jgi:NhaP-type Na+/H+ or K+/H+ antiporter
MPAMDDLGLVLVAAVFLAFAVASRRLDGTSITAAMVFVGAGFLFGDQGFGWLDIHGGQSSVRVLAESTLVIILFTDASRIDLRALRREYIVPVRLLGIGLPLTIAAGAIAAGIVLPSITWAEAIVLAIVLAPTDAALGQAVVTDKGLPSPIRQGLNVESGLNDGLCVPLLAIALAIAQTDAGQTTGSHAVRLAAEAIGWGLVAGAAAGVAAAVAVRASHQWGWVERRWLEIVPVATAVAAFGIADTRGGSGFIAAFVGGAVYGRVVGRDVEAEEFSEELGSVLNGLTLLVFGAAVLGSVWDRIGLAEVVYAVASLTVVRMVPVAIAMVGSHMSLPTISFLGWFGPRGLASIVFGVIVVETSGLPHTSELVTALSVTVALSVFAHGITAAPLARAYASWYRGQPSVLDAVPTIDQRWRHRWVRHPSAGRAAPDS